MTIVQKLRNKTSRDNRKLLDSAAEEIERLEAENKRLRDKINPIEDNIVWICVYRDTLGDKVEENNLAEICVPRLWLKSTLVSEGVFDFENWLDTYTSDYTESIVAKALSEGVILARKTL